ncbi:hypothetical protein JCM17960_34350 [Magnetospira thiophila]
MKIGFIFPSSYYLHDPFRGDPHTHFHLLTILEDLFDGQHEFELIDLRGVELRFSHYHVPECDLFLHSIYSLDWDEHVELLGNLRRIYPKAPHWAGGPNVHFDQKACLGLFDTIFLGEGEDMLIQAIRDFEAGKVERTYEKKGSTDINLYPVPRRHFLPKSTVARPGLMTLKRTPGMEKLLGTTVVFSRGCPYKCQFCAMPSIKLYSPSTRYRTPELIEAEITYLQKEFGVQGLSLADEIAIPLTPKRAIPHLEAFGRTGIVWRGQCRVDFMTPEIAKLTRESGCVTMGLGVESVTQASLDAVNKGINLDQTRATIRLLKEAGIEVRVYLIIGLPGEPPDVVKKTWDFIQETEPDLVYLSIFTPRPGTDIYNDPGKFGIEWIDPDMSKTQHMYGRYDAELPELNFRYAKDTQWGPGQSGERIIANYLELQTRLGQAGLRTL